MNHKPIVYIRMYKKIKGKLVFAEIAVAVEILETEMGIAGKAVLESLEHIMERESDD